jgi:hypothetical protein
MREALELFHFFPRAVRPSNGIVAGGGGEVQGHFSSLPRFRGDGLRPAPNHLGILGAVRLVVLQSTA